MPRREKQISWAGSALQYNYAPLVSKPSWPSRLQDQILDRGYVRKVGNADLEKCVLMARLRASFNVDIFRALDLTEDPAQSVESRDERDSRHSVAIRHVNCRRTVVDAMQVVGQTVAPFLGELSNFGDSVNSAEGPNGSWREGEK